MYIPLKDIEARIKKNIQSEFKDYDCTIVNVSVNQFSRDIDFEVIVSNSGTKNITTRRHKFDVDKL